MATNRAMGPYCAAPLQPSVGQVSQNSVRMYDGVLLFKHSSLRALMFSQKHDREITYLSFTNQLQHENREGKEEKKIDIYKLFNCYYAGRDFNELQIRLNYTWNVMNSMRVDDENSYGL